MCGLSSRDFYSVFGFQLFEQFHGDFANFCQLLTGKLLTIFFADFAGETVEVSGILKPEGSPDVPPLVVLLTSPNYHSHYLLLW